MFQEYDDIIRILKTQAERGNPVMPVASSKQIAEAELELGFELPPLLKRIYCEIGNGGRYLGPGFGLLGLPGGYDNDAGWNIIKTTNEVSAGLDWWDRIIVVCDWGCCMMSCVDCSDNEFMVYRYDGNAFNEDEDCEAPSDDLWSVDGDTFSEWILTPNAN